MTVQVQRIGDRFGVLLTEEQMLEGGLHEGSEVNIRPSPPEQRSKRYMTDEEALHAFESTREQYDAVYRALAK